MIVVNISKINVQLHLILYLQQLIKHVGQTEVNKALMKQRLNKTKSQTRVSINMAFHRWRKLMGLKGLKSDVMLAEFLLNRCFF